MNDRKDELTRRVRKGASMRRTKVLAGLAIMVVIAAACSSKSSGGGGGGSASSGLA